MHDDPNYLEVSKDVDMYVYEPIPKTPSLFQRIINAICLAFKNIYGKIYGKEIEKVYSPSKPIETYKSEPVDLKYVHVKDLNSENIKGLGTNAGIYFIRNRKTGRVTMTSGGVGYIKAMFNDDHEVVEASIKE